MNPSCFRKLGPSIALVVAILSPAAISQADAPMPNPEFPDNNPLLPEQDTLGKFLFWEEQMSHDNTMSCGTCHIHENGGSDPRSNVATHPGPDNVFGTDDDINASPGVRLIDFSTNTLLTSGAHGSAPQSTDRKSPPTVNAGLFTEVFWDGRAGQVFTDPQTGLVEIAYGGALESQAVGPPLSDVEMSAGGRTWDDVVAKLAVVTPMALAEDIPVEMQDFMSANPTYGDMFEAVYGTPEITSKRVAFAIANYERTLVSDGSPLDDFLKGVTPDLGPFQAGFDLFQGSANCAACHVMPRTMDDDFHNLAVRPDAEDMGRMNHTGDPLDIAKFKTPMVRNAALRVPLMHNGSIDTITDLIEFYNDGGGDFNEGNLDPNIVPLSLTDQEKQDLIDFIEVGMTDSRLVNNVHPFTRPTLRSELAPLNVNYGVASMNGSGGFASIYTNGPANRGNENFVIGLADAGGGLPAQLMLSFVQDLSGAPYPDPRYDVNINIGVGALFLKFPTVTSAGGQASFNLPIPGDAILAGFEFYGQWFVADVASPLLGDIFGTDGLKIQIL
ncbi:MAG: cytochrome c peroxidase [Planctomycetota bacterium]|jgi:cytochrome c peroxidase|nr:cytochrome c peroxidase [Planctomycetota bacterium]